MGSKKRISTTEDVNIRCMTHSAKDVVLNAFHAGKTVLPTSWGKYSKQVFTPAQLFALLAFHVFHGKGFRDTEAHVRDFFPMFREWLGLRRAPDHATLARAATRLKPMLDELHDQILCMAL